ncbi:SgcJ/EcaC family oxidoreductase [Nonomuraea fastidiosa]|jgi:uncharacterized protein (TIGR02246 family)|uniref:SgcJ/EcaC family oxidoreductase n=1 Tax=Nonomuraea fastidiosa TaxID=46173 RepID=UPI00367203AE
MSDKIRTENAASDHSASDHSASDHSASGQALSPGQGASPGTASANGEYAEIATLLTRLAEAWNAGDATAYAALFTEDADYITFDGRLTQGRDAIESSHRWLFDGPLKGSTMAAPADTRFKRLADGAVLVISTGGTTLNGQLRTSTVSFTAVRTPQGWRFASFQNTRVSH